MTAPSAPSSGTPDEGTEPCPECSGAKPWTQGPSPDIEPCEQCGGTGWVTASSGTPDRCCDRFGEGSDDYCPVHGYDPATLNASTSGTPDSGEVPCEFGRMDGEQCDVGDICGGSCTTPAPSPVPVDGPAHRVAWTKTGGLTCPCGALGNVSRAELGLHIVNATLSDLDAQRRAADGLPPVPPVGPHPFAHNKTIHVRLCGDCNEPEGATSHG